MKRNEAKKRGAKRVLDLPAKKAKDVKGGDTKAATTTGTTKPAFEVKDFSFGA